MTAHLNCSARTYHVRFPPTKGWLWLRVARSALARKPRHYIGDPQRVEQILVNLLGNAVKFTEPGGTIRLQCGATYEQGRKRAQFAVSDDGIGIPEDRLEAIFEPFVQATGGYTRPHGGTGLGLSISRRLAELMDGSIAVESKIGEGSRFTLTLPAAD